MQLYKQVTAAIPEGFAAAANEVKKAFFGETPLDHVFATEDGTAAVGVVLRETELADEAVENKLAVYQQYYSRMAPGFQMGEMRKNTVSGHNVAFMTYKSNAPTRDLYQVLAVASVEGRELLIVCACDMGKAIGYLGGFRRILESLTFC